MNSKQGTVWIVLIVVAVSLQAVMVAADRCQTPGSVVSAFTDAYFRYDARMADYMANEGVTEENIDVVDNYIYQGTLTAEQRGFDLGMLKSKIFDVRTYTSDKTEEGAKVRITAKRRTHINPAFFIVGKLFHLGETQDLDTEIEVVKKDGQWKVAGQPFQLAAM